eukprot:834949_1
MRSPFSMWMNNEVFGAIPHTETFGCPLMIDPQLKPSQNMDQKKRNSVCIVCLNTAQEHISNPVQSLNNRYRKRDYMIALIISELDNTFNITSSLIVALMNHVDTVPERCIGN